MSTSVYYYYSSLVAFIFCHEFEIENFWRLQILRFFSCFVVNNIRVLCLFIHSFIHCRTNRREKHLFSVNIYLWMFQFFFFSSVSRRLVVHYNNIISNYYILRIPSLQWIYRQEKSRRIISVTVCVVFFSPFIWWRFFTRLLSLVEKKTKILNDAWPHTSVTMLFRTYQKIHFFLPPHHFYREKKWKKNNEKCPDFLRKISKTGIYFIDGDHIIHSAYLFGFRFTCDFW